MPFVSIVLLYLLGLALLYTISPKFNLLEKLAYAFPLGVGMMSLMVFVISVIGIPITRLSILVGIFLILSFLGFLIYRKQKDFSIIFDFSKDKIFIIDSVKNIQLAWLLGFGLVIYILYALTLKSLYWPSFHYDSISGYDFFAKAIAGEQSIYNSMFSISNRVFSFRTLYPPMFPTSFAYAYIMGFKLPKIIVALYYISFALIYYVVSRKFVNPVSSIFFLAFLIITPEMAAQSAMLMTNVPQAVYSLAAVGAFFIWRKAGDKAYFFLSMFMAMFGVWGRSEGVVFGGTLIAIMVIFMLQDLNQRSLWSRENGMRILTFLLPMLSLYIAWEIFLKVYHLDSFKQPFTIIPYYDKEKIDYLLLLTQKVTFEKTYYGSIVYAFFGIAGLSVLLQAFKRKWDSEANLMIVYIFLSVFVYLWLYYQIEVPLKTFTGYITNGYKRGIFNLIPILALYMSNTFVIKALFDKMYFPKYNYKF